MAFNDWFKRSRDKHYTATYQGSRLNWDSGMSDSYSSFFAPDLDKIKLMKDSYKHACNIRNILEIPKSVAIKLRGDSGDSYSDTSSITVSTIVFDDKTLNNNQKLDVFLGTTIHEFAHILHTKMNKALECARKKKEPFSPDSIVFQIFNIIEDERIEGQIIQTYPGYANFLSQTKYYYFRLLYKPIPSTEEELAIVLQTLLYIVRYPDNVDTAVLNRHKVLFDNIRTILDNFGANSFDSCQKAIDIWKLIVDYFKLPSTPSSTGESEEPKEKNPSKDSNSKDSESQHSKSSSKSTNSSNDSSADKSTNSNSSEQQGEESNSSSSSQESPNSDSEDESEGNNSTVTKLSDQQISDIAQKMALKMRSLSNASHNKTSTELKDRFDAMNITDEFKEIAPRVFIEKKSNAERSYQYALDPVKSSINYLVNAFNKFFVEQEYRLTGMRRGKLDTNKLAEAYQGVETIYANKFKRTTPGLDICLLIDESGSMDGRKIKMARTAAVLLNEVCLRLPHCNLFIYGHTADHKERYDTYINVYRDKWNTNRYALGQVDAHSNNRDHEAIKQVHNMVRSQTKAPLLMFVISDGQPAAGGLGTLEGGRLVKETVKAIEAKGDTIICQIAIESSLKPETMFSHYVQLTDMRTFPKDLANYVLHTLVSKLKRVDQC